MKPPIEPLSEPIAPLEAWATAQLDLQALKIHNALDHAIALLERYIAELEGKSDETQTGAQTHD